METTAYIALSRQMVLRRQIDVISHNVANMNTAAFKSEMLTLEPVLADGIRRTDLAYVQDFATVRDLAPGPMVTTGNPFDVALDGPGYFRIETASGDRFTRAGHFRLSGAGELTTATGDIVRSDGGGPLILPADAGPPTISQDGVVSTSEGIVGRLDIVVFEDQQEMEPVGGSYYATDQSPTTAPAGTRVLQGMVEGANVEPVIEMTELMSTSRAYQSAQKLIETHHEVQRRAIERMLPGAS